MHGPLSDPRGGGWTKPTAPPIPASERAQGMPETTLYRRVPSIPDRSQRDRDLAQAIEAIDEVMMMDKGDPDLAVWANRYLPLVKRYGRQPITLDFVA